MQSLPNFTPHGGRVSRLTYAVEIKPKGFLPVNLIEGRIATDLKANLAAIRDYVENIAQRLREETALKAMKEEETIASQTAMLMECSTDTLNVVNTDMTYVGTISSSKESVNHAEQNFVAITTVVESKIDSELSRTSSHLIEEDKSQRVSRAAIDLDLDLTRDKAQLMRENEGIRMLVQAMEMDLGNVLSRIREIRSLTRSQLDQEAASA